jgi:hypothetical protein
MILTQAQLEALTGRTRSDAQRRELEHLGIPHRVRRDGTPVVLAADLPIEGTIPPKVGTPEPELHL